MSLNKDDKNFLDLINRSTPVIDGWCKVSATLLSHAQRGALRMPDLVEFGINRDRVGFIRLTKKGLKHVKPKSD